MKLSLITDQEESISIQTFSPFTLLSWLKLYSYFVYITLIGLKWAEDGINRCFFKREQLLVVAQTLQRTSLIAQVVNNISIINVFFSYDLDLWTDSWIVL